MKPGHIMGASRRLSSPKHDPLFVRDGWLSDSRTMTSAWYPTDAELDLLNAGNPVLVTLESDVHPPVILAVEPLVPVVEAKPG
jgi:hypothetical protein